MVGINFISSFFKNCINCFCYSFTLDGNESNVKNESGLRLFLDINSTDFRSLQKDLSNKRQVIVIKPIFYALPLPFLLEMNKEPFRMYGISVRSLDVLRKLISCLKGENCAVIVLGISYLPSENCLSTPVSLKSAHKYDKYLKSVMFEIIYKATADRFSFIIIDEKRNFSKNNLELMERLFKP